MIADNSDPIDTVPPEKRDYDEGTKLITIDALEIAVTLVIKSFDRSQLEVRIAG